MKYIIIISLIVLPFLTIAQTKLFGNGGYNVNSNRFYLMNGSDTIASFRPDSITFYKPTNLGIVGILRATTTWAPGSISNGGNATTSVSVAGAAVGDGVLVTKTGGYSNGELVDGWVTSSGLVNIRTFNFSGGGGSYSSSDYKIIVIKY